MAAGTIPWTVQTTRRWSRAGPGRAQRRVRGGRLRTAGTCDSCRLALAGRGTSAGGRMAGTRRSAMHGDGGCWQWWQCDPCSPWSCATPASSTMAAAHGWQDATTCTAAALARRPASPAGTGCPPSAAAYCAGSRLIRTRMRTRCMGWIKLACRWREGYFPRLGPGYSACWRARQPYGHLPHPGPRIRRASSRPAGSGKWERCRTAPRWSRLT